MNGLIKQRWLLYRNSDFS